MLSKSDLRKEALALRARLGATVPDFTVRIAALAGELEIPRRATVAGYMPFRGEADPRGLMRALAARGHPLALPRVVAMDAALAFHAWNTGDELVTSALGIAEPRADAPLVSPDVLLVPLLAFDARGYRLGYGAGHYDRTLSSLLARAAVRAIGVAYAGQEVDAIPHGAHDRRLDMVLTEAGVRRFG
jgi:5-formyltetrahydrofolate cyclo-ligase